MGLGGGKRERRLVGHKDSQGWDLTPDRWSLQLVLFRNGEPSGLRDDHAFRLLCDGQQVIPVDALVVADLVVLADAAGIDHYTPLLVCFWVEEVVAFRAEMERGLKIPINRGGRESSWGSLPSLSGSRVRVSC